MFLNPFYELLLMQVYITEQRKDNGIEIKIYSPERSRSVDYIFHIGFIDLFARRIKREKFVERHPDFHIRDMERDQFRLLFRLGSVYHTLDRIIAYAENEVEREEIYQARKRTKNKQTKLFKKCIRAVYPALARRLT